MPSDYVSSSSGALKLKGASVTKDKKKKKRPKPAPPALEDQPQDTAAQLSDSAIAEKASSKTPRRSISPDSAERDLKANGGRQKTEAEKRHEEMRRKRLEDRLKREGVKTHKEKVEELNKYLSGLSEHHDMPKIGPG